MFCNQNFYSPVGNYNSKKSFANKVNPPIGGISKHNAPVFYCMVLSFIAPGLTM